MLIICLLDSIICLLDLFGLTRFSSKRQSFLLTRFLNMLTRYAKLVYKFYFTSTVDFLIYFYAYNFKGIYAFELHTCLLQKLHGWIEIEIFYTKIWKDIWIYKIQLSNLTFRKLQHIIQCNALWYFTVSINLVSININLVSHCKKKASYTHF